MGGTFSYTSPLTLATFVHLLVISGVVVLKIGMAGTNEGLEGLGDECCYWRRGKDVV